jgi:hypothetical protein
MSRINNSSRSERSISNLGFEAKLCLTADKLRSNMDAAAFFHALHPGCSANFYGVQ